MLLMHGQALTSGNWLEWWVSHIPSVVVSLKLLLLECLLFIFLLFGCWSEMVKFFVIIYIFVIASWQILKSMGLQKTAVSALSLLIDIGYFPVHVNLDLLKLNLPTHHSEAIIEAAEVLLSESSDLDAVSTLPCFLDICVYLFSCLWLLLVSKLSRFWLIHKKSWHNFSLRFRMLTFPDFV